VGKQPPEEVGGRLNCHLKNSMHLLRLAIVKSETYTLKMPENNRNPKQRIT
jgi:hypothetical protein